MNRPLRTRAHSFWLQTYRRAVCAKRLEMTMRNISLEIRPTLCQGIFSIIQGKVARVTIFMREKRG